MKYYKKISFVLVIIMLIMTIISMFYLPNIIPSHYTNGHIDAFGSKYLNFIIPGVMMTVWVLLPFIESKYKKNESNSVLKLQICLFLSFLAATLLNSYLIIKSLKYAHIILSDETILNSFVFFIYLLFALFIIYMDNDSLSKLNWKEFDFEKTKNNKLKRIIVAVILCLIGIIPLGLHLTMIYSLALLLILITKFVYRFSLEKCNNK